MISNEDRKVFDEIIDNIEKSDPNNEFEYYQNTEKMTKILTKNLDDTIEFLNTCSKKELDWASACFEELSEYFKSQKLIDCVESNISRFDNPELQKQLKMELGYMKFYLNDKN